MATMRAWQYETLDGHFESNLKLNTIPRLQVPSKCSSAKDRCILVKVHAVSLNPADYKAPATPLVGPYIVSKPATPGLDYAGTIVSLPPNLKDRPDLVPGARVFGRLDWLYQHGTLAEYVLAQPSGIAVLPPQLSFEQGASLGTAGLSALQPLLAAGTREDAQVFVNGGSGGVGSFTVQIAKLLGARWVATTCGPANVERVHALGADRVLNYRDVDVAEALASAAKDEGKWYDAVIENVGDIDTLYEGCHRFVAPTGRFVQVAGTNVFFTIKRMVWPGFLGGGRRGYVPYLTKNNRGQLERLAGWAAEGKLKVEIDSEFGFEEAKEAFEKLRSGRSQGKIVVRVADQE